MGYCQAQARSARGESAHLCSSRNQAVGDREGLFMYCTTGTRRSGECLYPAGDGTGLSGEKSGPSGGESTGLVQRQSEYRRLLTRVLWECSESPDSLGNSRILLAMVQNGFEW
jgi:hypothetical protein